MKVSSTQLDTLPCPNAPHEAASLEPGEAASLAASLQTNLEMLRADLMECCAAQDFLNSKMPLNVDACDLVNVLNHSDPYHLCNFWKILHSFELWKHYDVHAAT